MAKDKPLDQNATAAVASVDPNLQLEVERLRLEKETLLLKKELLEKQNPPKPAEVEAKQQAARIDAEKKLLADLAEGPYKFRVHLPGNWPTTQPRDADPYLLVGASLGGEPGMREAVARYNKHMNIRSANSADKYQVQVAGKPPVEIGTEATSAIEVLPPPDPNPAPGVELISA